MPPNNKEPAPLRQPFYLDQIPTPEENPSFWDTFQNKEYAYGINLLILQEIRRADPMNLSDNQCRTQLSKIHALTEALDFQRQLKISDTALPYQDELPED